MDLILEPGILSIVAMDKTKGNISFSGKRGKGGAHQTPGISFLSTPINPNLQHPISPQRYSQYDLLSYTPLSLPVIAKPLIPDFFV